MTSGRPGCWGGGGLRAGRGRGCRPLSRGRIFSTGKGLIFKLMTHFHSALCKFRCGCVVQSINRDRIKNCIPVFPFIELQPVDSFSRRYRRSQAESDRESGASSPEGCAAQLAEPELRARTPTPHRAPPAHPHPSHPHSQHHGQHQRSEHLNGSMASMFQNLQNLANMQQGMPPISQQLSQQMSQLAANLQGLNSMPNCTNPVINSPLNLSVSAPGE
ncbi:hypothetical protein EVAR_62448_1 [Eumeta japonica]|uniref:Uncharacterized protein n=1 Tax=Eumeta variegata TaxID=151549 RepID=A0A4C1YXI1_EUMVA|nr:hypothetical protein EVAR_62448_1 [Eumeta japonica]